MALLQFDCKKGGGKTDVALTAGSAISGIVRVTADTSSFKRDAILALLAIRQAIIQAPWQAASGGLPLALRQVSTRCYPPSVASGTNAYAMCVTAHTATEHITSFQTKYPAWFVLGGIDTRVAAGLSYGVGLEYPIGGTITQLKWGGSATVTTTTAVDDTGLCDPAVVDIPLGATYRLRPFCVANGGTPIASGLPLTQATQSTRWTGQGEASILSATPITDQSMGGVVADGGSGAFIYPLCIVTNTTSPAVGIPGDSRALGTGMTPDANGCQGQITPSLGSSIGWIDMSVGGTLMSAYNTSGAKRTKLLNDYCSHIIVPYGINDLRAAGGNHSAAVAQGDLYIVGKRFPGKAIIGCTLSPSAPVSGDSYTSVPGQTADANSAAIAAFNTYVKTVPAPFAAAIDVAAVTADSGTPSKWKVDAGSTAITGDGLHCNATGYLDIVSSGIFNVAAIKALQPVAQFSVLQLAVAKATVWLDFNNPAVAPITGISPVSAGGPYFWATSGSNPTYSATGWQAAQASYSYDGATQGEVGDSTNLKPFTNGQAGVTLALMMYLGANPAGTRSFLAHSTGSSSANERVGLTVDSTGHLGIVCRRLDADAAASAASASVTPTATPTLVIGVFDPAGIGKATLFVNGQQVAQASFAATGNFSATNALAVALATFNANLTALTARDLVMCDSALSAVDRQKLEGDMAWRAGVAASVLPAGHPYLSAAPMS